MSSTVKTVFVVLFVLSAGIFAIATPIEVGSGDNTAGLYIEWKDGFSADFAVSFSADSVTGLELLGIAADNSDLDIVTISSVWGEYLDGMSYQGHDNSGFGGGEDWWHYWINDGGEDWISALVGASTRLVQNGSADGWVYGTDTIPEPATIGLLGLGGLLLRKRS